MENKKGDNRWLWTVVLCFGFLSFAPFIWAAIQTRSARFRTAAIGSSIGSAAAFLAAGIGGIGDAADQRREMEESGVPESVIDASAPSGQAWAYWVVIAVWALSSAYALYLNPEYKAWRDRRANSQPTTPAAETAPTTSPIYQPIPRGYPPIAPPPPAAPTDSPSIHYTMNIYGGTNSVNNQGAVVRADGDVHDVLNGSVEQSTSSQGFEPAIVAALIAEYRTALIELNHEVRHDAEHRLDQLESEIALASPNQDAVKGHLDSLKAIAKSAVTAGAGRAVGAGGVALLSSVLGNWPF